jgi:gluconolactonase
MTGLVALLGLTAFAGCASSHEPRVPAAGVDAAAATDAAPSAPTPPVEPARGAEAGVDDAGASAVDAAAAPATLGDFPVDRLMGAKPELYATMGGHLEGVSWRDGEVFFSVIPKGFFRIDRDQKIAPYASLASNGSFLLGDGSLLVCDDRNAMVQIFRDGRVGVLGTAGPKCNDVTVDAWGNIYFSDFVGTVFRIDPHGQQTRAVTGLHAPNGVEVDRESRYLYVMPRPADIYRVPIGADGPTGPPEKLGSLDGVTDGCAFDAWGNLWVSVYYAGKIGVFDPVKRQVLAYVPAGAGGLTNLTFGGPERDTLFVTIDNHGVYRIALGIKGFAGHPGATQYPVKSFLPARAGM